MRKLQKETSMRQYGARAIKAIGYVACLTPIALEAAQGVKIGPATRFESSAHASYVRTDNFYSANSNEVDGSGFLFKPTLGLVYAPSTGRYSLFYSGELGEFDTFSEDDFFDHFVGFKGSARPLTRHAIEGGVSQRWSHDAFGTARTSGQNRVDDRELDEWEALSASLKYTYGAESSRLNWFLRGGYYDRDYTTNEFDPDNPATGTRFLDRVSETIGTGVSYKLTPRSKLLLDIEHSEIEYDVDLDPSLDGALDKALLGIRWVATAKTTGEVWLGRFQRDFDDPGRSESTGSSWLAKITWAPRTYSTITFNTGQSVQETVLQGENFTDRQHGSLRWDHSWSTRFATYISYERITDDYVGTGRDDDIDGITLGGAFELSKFYSVSLSFNSVERDSNNDLFDFDRNYLALNFDAVF